MPNFDFNTIDDFDRHIELSIPNYEFMVSLVKEYMEIFAEPSTNIVDIGCSTGKLIRSLDKIDASYHGIDTSNLLKTEFVDGVSLVKKDIFDWTFPEKCSVISSIFFLQFLSPRCRRKVLDMVTKNLLAGGYFIVCEKTICDDPTIENVNTALYLQRKRDEFNDAQILDKSIQLTRSMFTITNTALFNELSIVGTPTVFFKSYGFIGYIVRRHGLA